MMCRCGPLASKHGRLACQLFYSCFRVSELSLCNRTAGLAAASTTFTELSLHPLPCHMAGCGHPGHRRLVRQPKIRGGTANIGQLGAAFS